MFILKWQILILIIVLQCALIKQFENKIMFFNQPNHLGYGYS